MAASAPSGLALTIDDLAIHFPGLATPALSIDRLRLAGAGSLAITGASGSGKTTFVNAITGLLSIDQGQIEWGGQEFSRLSSFRRDAFRAAHMGLVMQDFHLFPGLSALANVLLPVQLRRRLQEADRQRARDLLSSVGLSRPQQAIETLSRGEMQRVAIARALLSRPGVVVADEPTASLDRQHGEEIADLLAALVASEGASLIVVTHDPHLSQRLERHITFAGGRIMHDSEAGQ